MSKQESGPWVYVLESHIGGLAALQSEIDLGMLDDMKKVSDKQK